MRAAAGARLSTRADDALSRAWGPFGRVRLDPPYGRQIVRFTKKAHEGSRRGALVVALVPARTGTRWWHDWVSGEADVGFLRGRLRYTNERGEEQSSAPFPSALAAHAGRVILSSLFWLGGLNEIANYEATATQMRDLGFPAVEVPLTILLELGGGALVAVGRWLAVPAVPALAVHTIAVNAIFHRFWDMDGPIAALELSLFFKNVAVAGGLLHVAGMISRERLHPVGSDA